MRSVRPSLSIALFVGSAAAFACGGGGDDDDKMMQSTYDAAVVATGGAGASPGGAGPTDAGLPSNPLGAFDASAITGLIGLARDSGIIGTSPDGGIAVNTSAVCNLFPAACQDGGLSLPSGFGGGAGTGGLGLTGGGAAGAGGATGGINIGQICQTMPQICAAFAGGGTAGTGP